MDVKDEVRDSIDRQGLREDSGRLSRRSKLTRVAAMAGVPLVALAITKGLSGDEQPQVAGEEPLDVGITVIEEAPEAIEDLRANREEVEERLNAIVGEQLNNLDVEWTYIPPNVSPEALPQADTGFQEVFGEFEVGQKFRTSFGLDHPWNVDVLDEWSVSPGNFEAIFEVGVGVDTTELNISSEISESGDVVVELSGIDVVMKEPRLQGSPTENSVDLSGFLKAADSIQGVINGAIGFFTNRDDLQTNIERIEDDFEQIQMEMAHNGAVISMADVLTRPDEQGVTHTERIATGALDIFANNDASSAVVQTLAIDMMNDYLDLEQHLIEEANTEIAEAFPDGVDDDVTKDFIEQYVQDLLEDTRNTMLGNLPTAVTYELVGMPVNPDISMVTTAITQNTSEEGIVNGESGIREVEMPANLLNGLLIDSSGSISAEITAQDIEVSQDESEVTPPSEMPERSGYVAYEVRKPIELPTLEELRAEREIVEAESASNNEIDVEGRQMMEVE